VIYLREVLSLEIRRNGCSQWNFWSHLFRWRLF